MPTDHLQAVSATPIIIIIIIIIIMVVVPS